MKLQLNSSFKRLSLMAILAAVQTVAAANTMEFLNTRVSSSYKLEQTEYSFAQKNIDDGYRLLNQIMDGSYSSLGNQERDGADVVAVMWALFDAAVAKGQGFEQGSFVVEDRNWHLFHFLRGNQHADARHSSHLGAATRLSHAGHYGIDILGSYQPGAVDWQPYSSSNPDYTQQNILPARKGTILFIPLAANDHVQLQTNHIFIKPEDHGLKTWFGYAHHALDFVTGTVLGLGASPEALTRKERITPAIVKSYKNVLREVPADRSQGLALNQHAEQLGLRVMTAEVDKIRRAVNGQPKLERAILDFSLAVAAKSAVKNYDHMETRTGDEVIFSEGELQQAVHAHYRGQAPAIANQDVMDWEMDYGMAAERASEPTPAQAAAAEQAPASLYNRVSSWFGW